MRFWYQWIQRRKRKRRPDDWEADAEDDADNREREERETENSDSESEREGTEEDEDDDVLPAAMTGREAAGSVASIKETEQMFTKSLSRRDDWRHRAPRLQDMDYYHYARHVERVELPRRRECSQLPKNAWKLLLVRSALSISEELRTSAEEKAQNGPKCGTDV